VREGAGIVRGDNFPKAASSRSLPPGHGIWIAPAVDAVVGNAVDRPVVEYETPFGVYPHGRRIVEHPDGHQGRVPQPRAVRMETDIS
jgi:hypothetical protein